MRYSVLFLLCFVTCAGAFQLAPETAVAREEIAKLYRRIDEANNTGRVEEILVLALPEARAGSLVWKVALKDFINTGKRALSSSPGIQARISTSIIGITLAGNEAAPPC